MGDVDPVADVTEPGDIENRPRHECHAGDQAGEACGAGRHKGGMGKRQEDKAEAHGAKEQRAGFREVPQAPKGDAAGEEGHLAGQLPSKDLALRTVPDMRQTQPPNLAADIEDHDAQPPEPPHAAQDQSDQGQCHIEHDLDLEGPERTVDLCEALAIKKARQIGGEKV